MEVNEPRNLSGSLNRCPSYPPWAGDEASRCFFATTPADRKGSNVTPEKGAILEYRDESWIVGLTRAIVEAAVQPHSAQCLVEAKASDIGAAPQSCTQVGYDGIVCHWSVWSKHLDFGYFFKGDKVGAITPDLVILLP